ncbi:MAG: deoxyribose-phosphate aldolase [Kiritimatiellae bacterium]|nr:deoxyribose-phosphate aldolase [Kiritimatiellia bacterium]
MKRGVFAGAPPCPPQTPMRRFLDSLSLSMAIEPGCIRKGEVVQKLIIECCCLTNEEKLLACRLAKEAGFDFVKTSTGFAKGGATVEDVRLMSSCVGRGVGVKAAGGIRTLKDALAMIEAGATRIGTSSGIKILSEMD